MCSLTVECAVKRGLQKCHVCVCMCVCTYVYMYILLPLQTWASLRCASEEALALHVCMYVCVCVCECVCVCVCVHVCMYTCMHARMYTHMGELAFTLTVAGPCAATAGLPLVGGGVVSAQRSRRVDALTAGEQAAVCPAQSAAQRWRERGCAPRAHVAGRGCQPHATQLRWCVGRHDARGRGPLTPRRLRQPARKSGMQSGARKQRRGADDLGPCARAADGAARKCQGARAQQQP